MLVFWLYLIDLISNLETVLGIITAFSGIGLIILFIGYCIFSTYPDENEKKILNNISHAKKPLFIIFLISIFIAALFPSKTTMYTMAGSHYLNKTDIPDKVIKILNNKLDDIIDSKDSKKK